MTNYETFLARRAQCNTFDGFEPTFLPDCLIDFQRHLVEWAVRKGRSAILADCGLGKTLMQLVWAQNVVEAAGPVLVITPLAVSQQTVLEGEKFGIEVARSKDGKHNGGIVVTNYERLHHFDPSDFAGVVCDESSILKNFNGKTRQAVTEFVRTLMYRLLCTATAAPNDHFELGTSSEALGYLGYRDMLTMFFKEESKKDFLGWGRKTYRFRGHGEVPFWLWVASWARAVRKPSDLGFDDSGFELPELIEKNEVVTSATAREGMLFSMPARDLKEQREERRLTIGERCEAAARNASEHAARFPERPATAIWCHLNDESKRLASEIPGSIEVHGTLSDDEKEYRLSAFQSGEATVLVTKPKIGCFGLNWQHCCNVVTFPSHSWEQYYQLVRRCYRFGQTKPVTVTTIASEGEEPVFANLRRKALQAERMFSRLVASMNNAVAIESDESYPITEDIPSWL